MYNGLKILFYRWYPEGKIIFVAPTRPLVDQQIKACYKICGFKLEDIAIVTGFCIRAIVGEFNKTTFKHRIKFMYFLKNLYIFARISCNIQTFKRDALWKKKRIFFATAEVFITLRKLKSFMIM